MLPYRFVTTFDAPPQVGLSSVTLQDGQCPEVWSYRGDDFKSVFYAQLCPQELAGRPENVWRRHTVLSL
jgi:hypothetical protein